MPTLPRAAFGAFVVVLSVLATFFAMAETGSPLAETTTAPPVLPEWTVQDLADREMVDVVFTIADGRRPLSRWRVPAISGSRASTFIGERFMNNVIDLASLDPENGAGEATNGGQDSDAGSVTVAPLIRTQETQIGVGIDVTVLGNGKGRYVVTYDLRDVRLQQIDEYEIGTTVVRLPQTVERRLSNTVVVSDGVSSLLGGFLFDAESGASRGGNYSISMEVRRRSAAPPAETSGGSTL